VADDVGPAGYLVAYALAEANLAPGRVVVADCVNPLAITRQAWRQVAAAASAPIVEIEVVCSDAAEHRSRLETRANDVAGLALPSWEMVLRHDYEPWDRPHLLLDTAGRGVAEALAELRARIERS
jgi:predicted kinase